MKHFCEMNHDELMEQYKLASADFERCKQMELHLDMSRGKPSKAQLELSMGDRKSTRLNSSHTS